MGERSKRSRKSKLAWLLAAAIVVLACGAGVLHTSAVRDYVLESARQSLRSEFGIALDAEGLQYNLFTGRASLESLSAQALDAPDPFFSARQVAVDIGMLDLFGGVLHVENARIVEPNITLVTDALGVLNLPTAAEAGADESSPSGFGVEVGLLELVDGAFSFDDRNQQLSVHLPNWSLRVLGNGANREHRADFQTIGPGTASLGDRSLEISQVATALLVQPDSISIESLTLESAAFSVAAKGHLENFSEPAFTAAIDLSGNAQNAVQFLGLQEPIKGNVQLHANVTGAGSEVNVASTLESADFAYGEIADVALQLDSVWSSTNKYLTISSLDVRAPAGRARIEGQIATAAGSAESAIRARVDGLNLRTLSRQFQLPVRVASFASGTAAAKWPGIDFAAATGTASLQLRQSVGSPGANLLPLSGSLTLNAEGNRINLVASNLRALEAQFDGNVSLVDRNRIAGELSGEIPNLADVLRSLDVLLERPEGDSLSAGELDGAVEIRATFGGTISNPSSQAEIKVHDLQFGQVTGAELSLLAAYEANRVLLPEATLAWQNQTIGLQGAIGLEGDSPSLDLRLRGEQVSIADVLGGLGNELPIAGRVDLSADAAGTIRDPHISLALGASDLIAYGEPFGSLAVNADWVGQRLDVTSWRLDKPNASGAAGYLEASGNYDIESDQYAVEVKGEQLRIASLRLPDGTVLRGQLGITAKGEGSFEQPALDGRVEIADLAVGERSVGPLNASFVVDGMKASFQAGASRFNLSAKGSIGTSAPHDAEIEMVAADSDLEQLEIEVQDGQPLTGSISAAVRATGALNEWTDGEMRAQVTGLKAVLGKRELRNQGDLSFQYLNRGIQVGPAALLLGKSEISIEGSLPLDQNATPGALRIAGSLDLDDLASFAPADETLAAQGRLSLNAALSGSLESLTPTFEATLAQAALYLPALHSPLTEISGEVGLRGGSVALEGFQAEWAGARLSAAGRLPLGDLLPEDLPFVLPLDPGPATVTLDLTGLVIDSLPDLPREFGGLLSLHVDAEAARFEPQAVRANVRFDQMQFHYKTIELRQDAPATITLDQGRGRIEHLALSGPNTMVRAEGEIDLSADQALNLRLEANTDAGILALVSDGVSAAGPTALKLSVGGSIESPVIEGSVEITRGQVGLRTPRLQLANLDARVSLKPDLISIEQFSGTINGGKVQASGSVAVADSGFGAVNVDLSAENVFLDFPEGLRTVSDARLTLRSQDDAIVFGGGIKINEGSYTEPLEFDRLLLDYMGSSGQTTFETDPDPLLSRLRYGVDIDTVEALIIDNNLAELAAEVDLRLVGTYYRPSVTGRIQLREGGTLYLSENRYLVERGVIDFFNETRIEPALDITARTQVRRKYDIELKMSGGGAEDVSTTLTSPSHPELGEPDLISLLLTGRVREELRGEEINAAAEQSLSYLSGRIGSRLSRGAQSSLGLSEVRIEPNLIAAESDPGARLTVGQNITDQLQLIYSMDLADSSNQIWIAQYDVTKRLTTQSIKQDDNTYRFDLRHDLQFGGEPSAGSAGEARPKSLIGEVRFVSDAEMSDQELLKTLGIKTGKPFDFFELRRGADRLEKQLAERGHLEAKVQIDREVREATVDLSVNVEAGPGIEFAYQGSQIPSKTQREIAQHWRDGVFDAQRAAESIQAIRTYFVSQGHYESNVSHTILDGPTKTKKVTFEIAPGPHYERAELVFEGAAGFESPQLKKQIVSADLMKAVFTEPDRVVDFLASYYRANGYLDAAVRSPEYHFDPASQTGRTVIAIQEGALYRVGKLEFQGNQAIGEPELRTSAGVLDQQTYRPEILQDALVGIEERYWQDGYNDVLVGFNVTKNAAASQVSIRVDIDEKQKGVVQRVEVEGNRATSESLVRGQLGLEPGDTFSFDKVSQARRKLYQTGAYSLVDIQSDPLDPSQPTSGDKPLSLRVKVREMRPFQLRYGAFFDTERGPGAIADFTNRNTLGGARVLGFRTRYDSEVREARAYLSQPLLRQIPIQSTVTTFARRELEAGFTTDRIGISFNQETRWKETYVLNYGYRFEKTHTFEQEPDPLVPFDVRLNIAPLTTTFSRETRDEILDATKGSFWSNAVEYAPASLGSDLRFIKYFGQYFKYIPLGKPQPIPFQKRLQKSRLSYATGVRVGLARGLGGQILIPSERFFGGGGTSIRGFAQDAVGPVDFEGAPSGGDAVFVLNNEIRFPLVSFFDGVGFVDVGNVYRHVSDFDPFNVRKSAGFGLRVRTPYFLLRGDYGFKLDRKDGESTGAFFFSIGQAF